MYSVSFFFDETGGGVPLLVIYIKIENTHSFYILSYETKKKQRKLEKFFTEGRLINFLLESCEDICRLQGR